MKADASQVIRVWRWPAVIGALTLFGLLSALLGQGGIWWALSWIALSVPLLVTLRCWPLRRLLERKPRP